MWSREQNSPSLEFRTQVTCLMVLQMNHKNWISKMLEWRERVIAYYKFISK
jgi:hypothetical protein